MPRTPRRSYFYLSNSRVPTFRWGRRRYTLQFAEELRWLFVWLAFLLAVLGSLASLGGAEAGCSDILGFFSSR